MSSASPQRGKGFFQDLRKRVLNTLSGRKTIKKELFKPRKLSAEEERRKQTLTRKNKKTEEEKRELSVLTSKKAPKESEYRKQEKQRLETRSEKEKQYNKYYNKKVTVYYPVTPYPFYRGDARHEGNISEDELEMLGHYAESYRNSTKEISYDLRTGVPVNPTTGAVVDVGRGGELTPTLKYNDLSPTPLEFIKTGVFPFETNLDGRKRVFAFFYDLMTGVATNTEEYLFEVKFVTPQQMIDLSFKCRHAYDRHEGDLDEISQELFNLPLAELDRQILRMEKENWILPTASDPTKLVVGQSYGASFGRYISGCLHPRSENYQFDEFNYQCTLLTTEGGGEKPPIQSFDSPRDKYLCIGCFADMKHFLRWRRRNVKGVSNYIILHPKYLPIPEEQALRTEVAVRIQAGGFLKASFIQDAFKEQAVDTMDEDLFNLIRKKAPKLLEASKVILGTQSYLKSIPYQKLFTDRFILLAEEYFPETLAIAYRNPFLIPEVNSAMKRQRGFLFCDPYTAYCAKKKNPKLWHETFGAKFNATGNFYNVGFSVYSELNDIEKFLVDFYQFAYILERLQLRNNSGITNAKLLEASDIYKMPINAPAFINFIRENSGSRDELFKEFLKMQKLIITLASPMNTPSDIFRFLQKFSRMPVSFPGTNVNVENAAYLNRYFRHQRGLPDENEERNLAAEEARPRTSELPLLSLRRPLPLAGERLARLQAQLALRKSERNTMLRNGTVYNAQTRRRRNRGRVNQMYANMARIARTRSEKERVQVKRAAAQAKFNRLEQANQTIQTLEQQLRTLQGSALPSSPLANVGALPASPASSERTLSSTNTANLVANYPPAAAVLGNE